MKLQYMCLDSVLDLWPPGHFALVFFASRIGRSEIVSSLGLFLCTYVRKTLCLKVPDTHVSGDKIQRQFLALLPD